MLSGVRGYVHRPWANTFSSYPELYLQPDSIEQVQQIVREAAKKGVNIVVTGATHSPSLITWTSGWLINLDKCNRVLKIEESQFYSDVTVEAGLRLRDLNELLAAKKLSLQNLGSISEQSVAGAISTGTHGSSSSHGLVSEQIVSFDIVTDSGDIVEASESKNIDLFEAALLGLGCFGIIVRATIRCVPAFNLRSRAYVLDFDKLLSPQTWNKIFLESEYHRIWWYPYSNKCYVWQADKTDETAEPPLYSFYGTSLGRFFYELLLWVSVRLRPSLTPWVERWLFNRQFDPKTVTKHVGRSDQEINMDCLFKQFVNEWSLPLSDGPKALIEMRDEIYNKSWYVHAPIELRASNTTLPDSIQRKCVLKDAVSAKRGPVYGNTTRPLMDPSPELPYAPLQKISNDQLTLNINATMYRPFKCDPPVGQWYDFFEGVCESYGGKPHWAKIFTANPWTLPENAAKVQRWKAARKQWAPSMLFGGQRWLESKGLN